MRGYRLNHQAELAFTQARGPFRDRDPGFRQEKAGNASLGALPNAFATHCVPSLCWPSRTHTVPQLPEHPTLHSSSPQGPSGQLSGETAESGWSPEVRLCGLAPTPWALHLPCALPALARLAPSCR